MNKADRGWRVEVRFRRSGRWADWQDWVGPDPTTLQGALRWLVERAAHERWQERLGLGIDNSDRTYRLRNTLTGQILAADRFRFMFGARSTSACQAAAH